MTAGNADRAMTLMRTANSRIGAGDFRNAAEDLARAATLHAEAGREYDEKRCLQLASTLRRFDGDTEAAGALLRRAAAKPDDDLPLAVSIQAEQAEQAQAAGRLDEALAAWTRCLDTAEAAGLGAAGMGALLDRRSGVAVELGHFDQANADLGRACGLSDAGTAMRFRAQHAARLLDRGEAQRAADALPSVDAAGDDAETASMLLLQHARLARWRGDLSAAVLQAQAARAAARRAVAPVPYFAASVELAETLDQVGDRPRSYGTLASTWATLGDVLGSDVARNWVEPCLVAMRLRWGDGGFATAKGAYEAERRKTTGGHA